MHIVEQSTLGDRKWKLKLQNRKFYQLGNLDLFPSAVVKFLGNLPGHLRRGLCEQGL